MVIHMLTAYVDLQCFTASNLHLTRDISGGRITLYSDCIVYNRSERSPGMCVSSTMAGRNCKLCYQKVSCKNTFLHHGMQD